VKDISSEDMKGLIADRLEIPKEKVELTGQNPTGDSDKISFLNKQIKYSVKSDSN